MKLFLTQTSDCFAVISITAFLIISFSSETSAKRGCGAFGHSCYGGHGKRSDLNQHGALSNERNIINREIPEYVHTNEGTFGIEALQKNQERAERRISEIDKNQLGDDPLSILIRQWMIERHRPISATGSAYK
ncbi:uncharacterized protein LOC122499734 [Leptopilina heterotoma]|uniref:uncharacterized protein LOC122499734 n=1 Tax=Leptopilina heterotoma TaxID=63436 RepID=UPI001CA7D2BF|nr:uncharacterized protein LOC122499734 [Leptopilina heterotoma]